MGAIVDVGIAEGDDVAEDERLMEGVAEDERLTVGVAEEESELEGVTEGEGTGTMHGMHSPLPVGGLSHQDGKGQVKSL